MGQTDQEKRRARLDELREVRAELILAGGFKAEAPTDPGGAMTGRWRERDGAQGTPGGSATGERFRDRPVGSRGIDAGAPRPAAGRAPGRGGDRPILRMLAERRGEGSAAGGRPGMRGTNGSGDPDPQARRERLKRLLTLLDRSERKR